MIEAGWMLVVLICAGLAYRRVGRDTVHEKRLAKLEESLSEWPAPKEVLERLDELEAELEKLNKSDATIPAVVQRANVLTKDLLDLKQLVAEHRDHINNLRSRHSLKEAFTGG